MTTPQTERELLDAAIAAHAETLKRSPNSFAGIDAARAFESASGKYVHHLIASQTLTHPAAPDAVRGLVEAANPAIEAIQFALAADDGIEFLRKWNEGDFDACRKWWPEAPAAVYVGADPLHALAAPAVDGGEV